MPDDSTRARRTGRSGFGRESGGHERGTRRVRPDGSGRIGAALLAAGQSERFEGDNKLLATAEGTPIVRHAVETLLASEVDDVVVIVGYEAEAVSDALEGLDVPVRVNDDFTEGQSTSVREGVAVARERDWNATVFALGDMPFVATESVDALLECYGTGEGSIVAAGYKGKRGNPVLFDETHYETLAGITGDKGGRRLVEDDEDAVILETDDPGVTRDVDYEADLAKYTE